MKFLKKLFKPRTLEIIPQRGGKEYIIKNSKNDHILLSADQLFDITCYDPKEDFDKSKDLIMAQFDDGCLILTRTMDKISFTTEEFEFVKDYVEENFTYKVVEDVAKKLNKEEE